MFILAKQTLFYNDNVVSTMVHINLELEVQ